MPRTPMASRYKRRREHSVRQSTRPRCKTPRHRESSAAAALPVDTAAILQIRPPVPAATREIPPESAFLRRLWIFAGVNDTQLRNLDRKLFQCFNLPI